ncbi:MAG: hypothetical protein ACKPJT_28785 [Microcystis panniformis]
MANFFSNKNSNLGFLLVSDSLKTYSIRELGFRDCKTFARLPPRALVYPPTSPTAIAPPYIPNSDRPFTSPTAIALTFLKAIAFILKHGMGMKRWRLRLFS